MIQLVSILNQTIALLFSAEELIMRYKVELLSHNLMDRGPN